MKMVTSQGMKLKKMTRKQLALPTKRATANQQLLAQKKPGMALPAAITHPVGMQQKTHQQQWKSHQWWKIHQQKKTCQ